MILRPLLASFTVTFLAVTASPGNLRVSPEGRIFTAADGQPFLWIGDTAWELFHRLDRDEARHYLTRRAEQGFNVIQAVMLAERDGLRVPNAYGHVPFHDLDPRRPNEAYFEHVDFIVREAARLGFYIALLPTWGDKVAGHRAGSGPVVFNPDNAADYGRFLGHRYREARVIWMLGGDRSIEQEISYRTWDAMAAGIREGDGGAHLMTYHPAGGDTSAMWFHNAPWLDFNVFQSGHEKRFNPVYRTAAELALLQPRKPFLDAEPPYEDIAIRFWDFIRWGEPDPIPPDVIDAEGMLVRPEHFSRGFFDAHDVRVSAYWSLLAGGAGFTYGHNAVWQMHRRGEKATIPTQSEWREALDRPGARSMQHLRRLFEQRPFFRLRPDQSIVYGDNPDGPRHIRAALDHQREFALVYLAEGRSVELVLGKVRGDTAIILWFDPRTGEIHARREMPNTGRHAFTPPTEGPEEDWILIIEAADANLPALKTRKDPPGGPGSA